MKKVTETELLNYFEKGFGGFGDDSYFTITEIGGKRLKNHIIISQRVYSICSIIHQSKGLLSQLLNG